MSDDLIRRSDAIGACAYETIECYEARKAIRALPSADRPQEWIPVDKRLPTEKEQDNELGVLVTLGNGYSGLQYDWYHNGHWYDWDGFIIAWMPLPEPYCGADMREREGE